MMKLTTFLIFALTLNLNWSQKEEVSKKYQSLLWEITKPGNEGKSYLYGTMHVYRSYTASSCAEVEALLAQTCL